MHKVKLMAEARACGARMVAGEVSTMFAERMLAPYL